MLSRIITIEVAAYDINIAVAGIPVAVCIVFAFVTVIILRGPNPNKVMDTLLLEVVEHGCPQLLIYIGSIIAPPEPGTAPVSFFLQCRIAGSLMERTPQGNDTGILKFQKHLADFVHLTIEPLILP